MRASFVIAIVLGLSAPAAAQQKAGDVRRDPKGLKGISPYNEELAKGRKAMQANNVDGAIRSFEAAIDKDTEAALGYLLLAQAQLQKGDLDGALETAEKGRTKAGPEEVQSKMLFFRSDLLERKHNTPPGEDNAPGSPLEAIAKKWQEAKAGWNEYTAYLAAHSKVPDHRSSAQDRGEKIDARVKRDNDYAPVRKRILDDEKSGGK